MTEIRIYFDHNATSPVRPEAARAIGAALVRGGNPSSVHAEGRKARATVESARGAVAALVGARATDVVFTSGATEALNLALTPSLSAGSDARRWRLFVSATEHPAVLNGHRFPTDSVDIIPAGPDGLIDLAALEAAMDRHSDARPLVALQLANSETGIVQPVANAAALVHVRGGLLVCDAVQAAGRIPVDIAVLGVDLMAISGHKIGGPAGIGALIRGNDAIHIGEPLVRGGGQEKGWRGGTENVAGIAGFAAAAEAASASLGNEAARLGTLRDRIEAGLRDIDGNVEILGSGVERLPNTICFGFRGISAENALIAFDLSGIALSAGSACSSGKTKPSHVLEAMGVNTDIRGSMLRASLGWTTKDTDVGRFLEAVARLRANNPAVGKVLAA